MSRSQARSLVTGLRSRCSAASAQLARLVRTERSCARSCHQLCSHGHRQGAAGTRSVPRALDGCSGEAGPSPTCSWCARHSRDRAAELSWQEVDDRLDLPWPSRRLSDRARLRASANPCCSQSYGRGSSLKEGRNGTPVDIGRSGNQRNVSGVSHPVGLHLESEFPPWPAIPRCLPTACVADGSFREVQRDASARARHESVNACFQEDAIVQQCRKLDATPNNGYTGPRDQLVRLGSQWKEDGRGSTPSILPPGGRSEKRSDGYDLRRPLGGRNVAPDAIPLRSDQPRVGWISSHRRWSWGAAITATEACH